MQVQIPTNEFIEGLKEYDKEYLRSEARFNVLMWHRGSRKTTKGVNKVLIKAFQIKGLYWIISPYLTQGKATIWKDPNTSIFRWLPEGYKNFIKVNNSDLSLELPNGSIIQLKGADNMDSLRGPKPMGIYVDEYGEIAKRHGAELREAVLEPSVRSSGGWIDYGGTPKGNNDFTNILSWSKDKKDWWGSKQTVEDTGMYTQEELEEIKSNITNIDFFRQEYYCDVLDGAMTVFKKHHECVGGFLEEPKPGHRYIFGIDLARTFDRTAIVGFDTHSNQLVYFKTLSNESWEQQRITILSILERYNNAQAVVDATGVGDSFVEQLGRTGVNIYPFKITSNAVKRNLIEKMAMFLENKYITYPDIEEIKDELNSFEFEVTTSNNITYSAPVGKHDDIVLAIALAIQLLNPVPTPFKEYTQNDWARDELSIDVRTGYLQ